MSMTETRVPELKEQAFPRPEKRGVVLGLDPKPLVAVIILGALIVLAPILGGFPWGLVLAMLLVPVAGFVGWFRYRGRNTFDWFGIARDHLLRQLRGQNEFRDAGEHADAAAEKAAETKAAEADAKAEAEAAQWDEPVPAKTPKPRSLRLPGAANELKSYTTPRGREVLHNPLRRRITVTLRLGAQGFTLEDDAEQGKILDQWATVMDILGGRAAVEHLFASDVTTVVTGQQMQTFYEEAARAHQAGAQLNPVAHQGYLDLLSQHVMTHHPQYLTINLSIPALKQEIKANGAGVKGLLVTADEHMDSITQDLRSSGFKVEYWVDAPTRKQMLVDALSPDLDGLVGSEQQEASSEAPALGARRFWSQMRVDDVWHRAFIIDRWPVKPVRPGFLEKLILELDFRHTVTLAVQRGDDEAALSKVNREITDQEMAENFTERSGRRVSLEMRREKADLEERELELVSGAADMRFRAFVSITAASEDELEQYTRDLRSAAARAQVRLQPAYGQQFEGFLAAACHVGMGWD